MFNFRMIVSTFLMCCFLIVFSLNSAIAGEDVKFDVENVLLDEGRYRDSSKTQQLIAYSKHSGVAMGEIKMILLGFMEEKCMSPHGYIDKSFCKFSMEILGDLKFEHALPLLKNLEQQHADQLLRSKAAVTILEIGGDGLIDYAKQLLMDNRYSHSNRFRFHEVLGYKIDGKQGEAVKQLLVNALAKETGIDIILKIDKGISKADDNYSNSYYRESILNKISTSEIEKHIKYSTQNLQELRAMPVTERTVFKMRPVN